MTDPLQQEVDALEALAERIKTGYFIDAVAFNTAQQEYLDALRNRAMPLIRALRERVSVLECSKRLLTVEEFTKASQQFQELRARIESLKAERDIWRERTKSLCFWSTDHEPGICKLLKCTCVSPTPSEIAARIQQKKTEAKPK